MSVSQRVQQSRLKYKIKVVLVDTENTFELEIFNHGAKICITIEMQTKNSYFSD